MLERWGLTVDELTQIVDENPSLRGFMMGYVSEAKVRKAFFEDPRIEGIMKDDDHDRKKKGDLTFTYRGREIRVEVKSLQTSSVKPSEEGYKGTFQCDASDCRDVILPTRKTVKTTCLLIGEFDIVAVNLFAFEGKWRFAFAKNSDLPRVTSNRGRNNALTEEDKKYLLSTSMKITWPLQAPFVEDPFILLDQLIEEQETSLQKEPLVEKPVVLEDMNVF
ncbi:hypothetical protein B9G55_07745 [Saccharibacillus sp. O16]|nr:hypothetical protein B9G55_07745 [Saccharibacillus sp. O16]